MHSEHLDTSTMAHVYAGANSFGHFLFMVSHFDAGLLGICLVPAPLPLLCAAQAAAGITAVIAARLL